MDPARQAFNIRCQFEATVYDAFSKYTKHNSEQIVQALNGEIRVSDVINNVSQVLLPATENAYNQILAISQNSGQVLSALSGRFKPLIKDYLNSFMIDNFTINDEDLDMLVNIITRINIAAFDTLLRDLYRDFDPQFIQDRASFFEGQTQNYLAAHEQARQNQQPLPEPIRRLTPYEGRPGEPEPFLIAADGTPVLYSYPYLPGEVRPSLANY